jgi:hypothetical protein
VSNDPAGEGTVYYLDAASLPDVVGSGVDTLVFDLDDDGVADVEDPIVVAVLDRQDLALGSEFGAYGAYSDSTNYDLSTDDVYLNASALVGLREIGVDTLAFDLEDSIAATSYLELDTVELPYTNVDGILLSVGSVHEITAVDRYLTYNVTAVVDNDDLEYLGSSGFDSDSTVYLDAEKLQAIAYLGVDNLALDLDLDNDGEFDPDIDIVATLGDPEGFEALDWLMGGSDNENLAILFLTLDQFGVDRLEIDWAEVSTVIGDGYGFFGATSYGDLDGNYTFGNDSFIVNVDSVGTLGVDT